MITDIYRIKTMNSVYEIHISDTHLARCRKEGEAWRSIALTPTEATELMEKLYIGVSFKVPGVVTMSNVQDYQHYVPSGESKRDSKNVGTIGGFFEDLTNHVVRRAKGY
jgi:hypothetical protein